MAYKCVLCGINNVDLNSISSSYDSCDGCYDDYWYREQEDASYKALEIEYNTILMREYEAYLQQEYAAFLWEQESQRLFGNEQGG